jgi:hypothetical protein
MAVAAHATELRCKKKRRTSVVGWEGGGIGSFVYRILTV